MHTLCQFFIQFQSPGMKLSWSRFNNLTVEPSKTLLHFWLIVLSLAKWLTYFPTWPGLSSFSILVSSELPTGMTPTPNPLKSSPPQAAKGYHLPTASAAN